MAMNNFPNIVSNLRTTFDVNTSLSEDVAIRFYKEDNLNSSSFAPLKAELKLAFGDPDVSWQAMLANEEYEVYCAKDEADARAYAKKILWDPIFGE
jgi:hypothetical protein